MSGCLRGDAVGETLSVAELQRLRTKANVFCWQVSGEKVVDALSHTVGFGDAAERSSFAKHAADVVGDVVKHRQVVVDDDDVLRGREKRERGGEKEEQTT